MTTNSRSAGPQPRDPIAQLVPRALLFPREQPWRPLPLLQPRSVLDVLARLPR